MGEMKERVKNNHIVITTGKISYLLILVEGE